MQASRFEGNDLRGNPCIGVLFALVLGGCAGRDKNEIALVNPGFEAATQGNGIIPGWMTAQHAGPISYEMTIDRKVKAEGAASFRITRKREQVYGSVSQRVPAADLAGKTVELSAMLKTERVGEKGWSLRLRPVGAEDNTVTAGTLTGTTEFTRVAAKLQVPQGTRELEIFATLKDGGSAWLDDVHLRVVEP